MGARFESCGTCIQPDLCAAIVEVGEVGVTVGNQLLQGSSTPIGRVAGELLTAAGAPEANIHDQIEATLSALGAIGCEHTAQSIRPMIASQ